MKCSECDLPKDVGRGLECPFRERVSLDDDACDAGQRRKADQEARAAVARRGRSRGAAYEQTTPHGDAQ